MQPWFGLAVGLALAGINFGLAYKCLTDPVFVRRYAESNPKAAFFRMAFGVDRTVWFMRTIAPVMSGLVGLVGLALAAVAVFALLAGAA